MNFNVEVVLKGRDFAVTEAVSVTHGEPASWDAAAVRDVLIGTLRAIDRVQNPTLAGRMVALRGFSWIVEPEADQVVIAIEIPAGAAVAGPFKIEQKTLDALITKVLQDERRAALEPTVVEGSPTIH